MDEQHDRAEPGALTPEQRDVLRLAIEIFTNCKRDGEFCTYKGRWYYGLCSVFLCLYKGAVYPGVYDLIDKLPPSDMYCWPLDAAGDAERVRWCKQQLGEGV